MLRCFNWASAAWQAAKRELKLSFGRLLTVEFPPLVRKLSLFQAACICLQAGMSQAGRARLPPSMRTSRICRYFQPCRAVGTKSKVRTSGMCRKHALQLQPTPDM